MFKKTIFLLTLILFLGACGNNQVNPAEKEMQYSIIRGLNASQEGKYNVAIQHFLKAYAINSKELYTLRELGYNYGASGDFAMAEKYYLEALAVNPNDSRVVFNLGTIYFNQKKYEESLKILSNINIENITVDIRSLMAYNLYNLNKVSDAYSILKPLENVKKDDLYFVKIYGDVLLKTGRIGELHPYITKLYKEKDSNPEIVYIYAKHLHYNLYKGMEALEAIETYIINYGVYKEVNLEGAKIACDIGRFDMAKKYIDLIPDKLRYEEEYLNVAIRVYTGLKDDKKIMELKTVLEKVKKE